MKKIVLLLALGVWWSLAWSAIETYEFDDPKKESDYKQLIQELRCLVCQNQNLADSNAELAQDLRNKTYEMVQQGLDQDQVVEYMVQRYGDFVLYRPPLQTNTLVLWIGPFVIMLVGLMVLLRIIRRRSTDDSEHLSEEDRKRAETLLAQGAKEEK